jgi:hypothetical protein
MDFDLSADKKNEQAATHEVSGNALSLRGTIVGALLLVAFDGVAMGQGGLALLLATWVVYSGPWKSDSGLSCARS